jgi:hypothetical protein
MTKELENFWLVLKNSNPTWYKELLYSALEQVQKELGK